MNDAKCPKLTVSEQGALGCFTLRGQQLGPHRKKEPLQIRAVPTPAPVPILALLSGHLPTPQTHCRMAQLGVAFVQVQPTWAQETH